MGFNVEWKVKHNKGWVAIDREKTHIIEYLDAEPGQDSAKPYIMEMEQPYLVAKKMVAPKYSTDYKTFKRLEGNIEGRGCFLLSVYYLKENFNAKYIAKYVNSGITVVGEHENEMVARLLAIYEALTGKNYIDKMAV